MNDLTIAEPFAADAIRSRILTIRGVQVMLAPDLAMLYSVPTKRLNEQVKRNIERFPERFMFQLTAEEVVDLRSQIATSNNGAETGLNVLRSQFATSKRGGTRYLPYAFTEHGIIMLASVLNSPTAIAASVRITDTFVAMRRALASITPLLARIEATDRRQIADQAKNDANQARNEERFKLILDAMQDKKFPPQKVFYDGQIYDAFEQMKKFVRMAKAELISIDPYFADCVLPLIAQKRQGVAVLAVKAASCRRCGEVQRAVRQLAHGQDLRQVPRPLPHHRQNNLDSRRCVPQPPRQEVLCVLVTRQVQHP